MPVTGSLTYAGLAGRGRVRTLTPSRTDSRPPSLVRSPSATLIWWGGRTHALRLDRVPADQRNRRVRCQRQRTVVGQHGHARHSQFEQLLTPSPAVGLRQVLRLRVLVA
jgi:hypothetical protein